MEIAKNTLSFRPLRFNHKKGKLIVASYMCWRKIKVADLAGLHLEIVNEYSRFPNKMLVCNHKGENLFWRNHNPDLIPMINEYALVDGEKPEYPEMWQTDYGMYAAKGLDCDGVPAFTHGTIDNIYNSKSNMNDYEPLTAGVVKWWFGWFLYNLKNTTISFK